MYSLNREFSRVSRSMTRDLLGYITKGDFISFAGGAPDPALLDSEGLGEMTRQILDERGASLYQYSVTEGEPELRQAMAAHCTSRGIPTAPEQLLITTGSQEVLFLLARVCLNPGDVVLVEGPTYPAAIQAFTMAGARVITIESDDEGILPDALDQAIRTHNPKIVYLIPVFQNPTGRSMSPTRARDVVKILNSSAALVVEDDAYSPLAFDGQPRIPLSASIESEAGALYMASLSKFMSPAMRIGAARIPEWLFQPLLVAKQVSTLHNSVLDQLVAARWLASSRPAETLSAMRTVYASRCRAQRDCLTEILPDGTHITQPTGGMFLWADIPPEAGHINTLSLIDDALAHSVAFVPGTEFFPDSALGIRSARFSFAGNSESVMREGMERLGAVFAQMKRIG